MLHQYEDFKRVFQNHCSPIEADTDFALNLLRQQDLSEPIVLSPLSITMSCASLGMCTEGKTKKQIVKALFPSKNYSISFLPYWIDKYREMIDLYEYSQLSGQVNFATHFHVIHDLKRRHYPIRGFAREFVTNFNEKTETAEIINSKMSEMTRTQITDIVTPDGIEEDADVILASGTQVTGCWKDEFDSKETTAGEFYSSPYSKRSVYYLSKQFTTEIAQDGVLQVVRIKFQDESFSLDVFLPREQFGLKAVLKNLTMDTIQELYKKFKDQLVHVKIPKFRTETKLDLTDSLNTLGVRRVFKSGKAQLGTNRTIREKFERLFHSNSTNKLRCLSQMPHKAVLEVRVSRLIYIS
ncbi:hypothetical protein CAEBREN_20534 [Caenorhabditis brenneri]|uniref:Serpin domain-containing protein n=1 Tax=Caenorhabditis brenneri TaxID=135651 RepID=G0M9Y4_CAEBE|nr:hypothetical protein CAEBREN_20534 [Caenorhabditis brenneri]